MLEEQIIPRLLARGGVPTAIHLKAPPAIGSSYGPKVPPDESRALPYLLVLRAAANVPQLPWLQRQGWLCRGSCWLG